MVKDISKAWSGRIKKHTVIAKALEKQKIEVCNTARSNQEKQKCAELETYQKEEETMVSRLKEKLTKRKIDKQEESEKEALQGFRSIFNGR